MGKIAFVFPGQGAQYSGMGRELTEVSLAANEIFRLADTIRPGTSEQCFCGSETLLKETKITQPCLFTVELAAAAALTEAGIQPDMVAGFSLGELSALTFTEIVDISTSFQLVSRRGELMQAAAEQAATTMAAVLRLDSETVEQICGEFDGVYPVNYNCPGQVTVALKQELLADFSAAVKSAKGRALPLKVSGGFHSPFMADAAAQFAVLLENVAFRQPSIPVYSNCTGLPYGADIRETLSKQIASPVRWEDIIRHMIAEGTDTFIEAGPGNVLQGLIQKIDPSVRTFGVSDRESLHRTLQEVTVC